MPRITTSPGRWQPPVEVDEPGRVAKARNRKHYGPIIIPDEPPKRRAPRAPKAAPDPPPQPLSTERDAPPPPADEVQAKLGKIDPRKAAALALVNIKYGFRPTNDGLTARILYALPTPHQKQIEIESSTAKRKVINTGRRVGKTTGGAREAVKQMTRGRRVLLASTTQKQADAFWESVTKWMQPFIERGELEKNETRRSLVMPSSGGRITVKTASDADTLRGDYADFLILDECAMLDPAAWDEVGAPMLLDNGGDAWFLSTPRRRNWFFGLYQRAVSDTTGRWAYFHATSFDNPHLDQDALREIIGDLTEDAYRQEILAEFLEGEGAVFRNIMACMTAPRDVDPEIHRNHYVVMGTDWGQRNDYTVNSVFCADCMQELFLERFNRMEWAVGRDRMVNAHNLFHVKHILAEHNSIGGPNIEALQRDDRLNIDGLDMNKATKPQVIRGLALALERMTARWLPDPVGVAELEGYEAVVSRVTGHVSYSAPKGMHDDTVMARGIALFDALSNRPTAQPSYISYTALDDAVDQMQGSHLPTALSYGSATGYNEAIIVPPGRPW